MVDALIIPKEVQDVLNTSFMGFKLWHLLIVALLLPSPIAFLILFFAIPGFKEKVTEVIRNGYPAVSSVFGEVNQVPPEGGAQNPTEA
jgi:hypothetical protein